MGRLLRTCLLSLLTLPVLAAPAPEARYTDAGPEPLLVSIFETIEQSHFDQALKQVDALLKAYPNFRLAHLIRGDLLLARTRPISTFGEGGGKAQERVADLRDEAIARLKAYKSRPPANYEIGRAHV